MEIKPVQPMLTRKSNFTNNIKRKFMLAGMFFSEIGYLAKDVFIPREKNYIKVDGKLVEEEDLPRCIIGMNDNRGVKWVEQIVFSPEDTEKLRQMKKKDYITYRNKLLETGNYHLLPLDK